MGAITTPGPVKLIVGMLSGRQELLAEAVGRLTAEYGPVDVSSGETPFDATDYYDEQMGAGLLRRFVAFRRLIRPEQIRPIKRATNEMEAELAAAHPAGPPRPVNLDPGYVSESKLVLASTKDYAHRIYLGEGIYAEVTLTYAGGRWVAHRHTFPDYASGAYDEFLTRARRALRGQLRSGEPGGDWPQPAARGKERQT